MMSMRREFNDRADLQRYLHEQFPEAPVNATDAGFAGGLTAARERLQAIDPLAYRATRNELTGAVTRLSPYLRHGVVTLADVKREVTRRGIRLNSVTKFLQELTWREYYQRVWAEIGDGIWHDRESYKTGFSAWSYSRELPEDIRSGTTGMRCIDAFSRELRETGYLHNHARMWLAAYIVHARRIRWQAGARWFLQHLLDGDPASNNLSWQWIASTFAHKPYIFNRENLERLTDGRYCRECPLLGRCEFDGSYAEVSARWFPNRVFES